MFKSRTKFLTIMACLSFLLACGTFVFCLDRQQLDGSVNIQYTAPKDFLTYELNSAQDGWVVTGYDESKRMDRTIIEIPDTHTQDGKTFPVTEIKERAFYSNSSVFTGLQIGNNVTTIGNYAFYGCSSLVGQLTIPDNLISIGHSAFYKSSKINSVKLGESLQSIGDSAFYGCVLTGELQIPKSITYIGSLAFLSSKFTIIRYHGTLKQWCEEITGGGSGSILGPRKDFYIDGTKIENDLVIAGDITKIHDSAFWYLDSITSLTIGNSVIDIGGSAFDTCSRLTKITIGENVKSIGAGAFNNCWNVTELYFNAANCTAGSFNELGTNTKGVNCIFGESVTKIPSRLFCTLSENEYDMPYITSVTIGSHVEEIGDIAFLSCPKLNEVIIKSSTIYKIISSSSSSDGSLINKIKTGETIKVLSTIDDGTNEYLSDETIFTQTTQELEDGVVYNVYTMI